MINRTFVIDGIQFEVRLERMKLTAELIDVTSFLNSWREFFPSGRKQITLKGIDENGREINGVFTIVSVDEFGVMEIKSQSDFEL